MIMHEKLPLFFVQRTQQTFLKKKKSYFTEVLKSYWVVLKLKNWFIILKAKSFMDYSLSVIEILYWKILYIEEQYMLLICTYSVYIHTYIYI